MDLISLSLSLSFPYIAHTVIRFRPSFPLSIRLVLSFFPDPARLFLPFYPIPTAAFRTAPWLRLTLWGWGKCCTSNDCTSSGGGKRPRTQSPCPVQLSASAKFTSYGGIEAENAHFQPSAWGFLTTKHSRRFANDAALA